jgi:hypothetical protein
LVINGEHQLADWLEMMVQAVQARPHLLAMDEV